MESRKPVRKLAESIRSLLGLKTHLTSSWADSVCNILKDLPPEEPSVDSRFNCLQYKILESSESKDEELDISASKIQDDLATLNSHLNQLNLQRRQALSDYLDLKGNIRVFCRVRPNIEGEEFSQPRHAVVTDSNNIYLKLSESKSKRYNFDKVFFPGSSQDEVFLEIEPVIKSAIDGYNACIFAYGQTGTGKTFTMEGKADCPGVVPRAIEALFQQAVDSNHTFFFTFSMLEIYMGNLRDLLIPHRTRPTDPMTQCLSIQTDPKGGIEIENLVTIRVSDFNQAKRLYILGSRFRSTASTNSNATSSRSHCLTRISLTCFDAPERRRETNKIWMVDLGGSERVLKTKAWGRRFEEGKSINLSLSALGDVISALQRRKSHVPYRNSKLTQVLRDSLGEDSRTLMLVHVSPKEEDLCETVCSLGFATRVRSIHLGHDESTEAQVKKEFAMANLLQKVKQLENERQDAREKIKNLNDRLEHFTRKEPLDANHLCNELLQGDKKMEREGAGAVTSSLFLQLPRFMRPTVCSRKKFGMDHHTKDRVHKKGRTPSRRKISSTRAESVSFPIKGISEYGSECSISKTSCFTDYGTEYSQNTSECDVKMVVNTIESSESNSAHEKSQLSNGNGNTINVDSSKCLTVDDWLRLQKNKSTGTRTHGNKRVLAIPLPVKKKNSSTVNKANIVDQQEEFNHDFTRNKSHDEAENLVKITVSERSTAEVAIHLTRTLLDIPVIDDSGSEPISPYEKIIEATQCSFECTLEENDICHPVSPPDIGCNGLMNDEQITQQQVLVTDEIRCSKETYTSKVAEHNTFYLNEEYHDPLPESEMESESPNLQTEVSSKFAVSSSSVVEIDRKLQRAASISDEIMSKEVNDKVELCISPQRVESARRISLYNMKSRRALCKDLNGVDQMDYNVAFGKFDEETCNPGMFKLLGKKVQTLHAGALLALGFQDLGLEQDFFYALTL